MSAVRILQALATPAGAVGGMEHMAEALAAGLQARGHEIVHAYLGPHTRQIGPDVWQMCLPAPRTIARLPTPRSTLAVARGLAHLAASLRRIQPDVVHFHYPTWEALPFLALRPTFGYRLVLTAHGNDVTSTWPVARAVMPTLLRRADAITTVSPLLAESVRALQPTPRSCAPIVIPNGIRTDFWTPDPAPQSPPSPTIVTVARLEPVKAHSVLLDAFAEVVRAVPDARLRIIGDGSERSALERQARDLGLQDAVRFTGTLSPAEVRTHLREAAAFALPSRMEGMPLALLEALATGCPAVASAVGGIPEVLTSGGVLVPPSDASALAHALTHLLLDEPCRQALAQEATVLASKYDVSAMVDAYEAVLLGPHPGPLQRRNSTPPTALHETRAISHRRPVGHARSASRSGATSACSTT